MRAKYANEVKMAKSGELKNTESYSLVPDKGEEINENNSRLYIEPSERPDPRLPAVLADDIVDMGSDAAWTTKQKYKRIAINTSFVLVCLSLWYFAYQDIATQRQTGGFQGVWLGKSWRIL